MESCWRTWETVDKPAALPDGSPLTDADCSVTGLGRCGGPEDLLAFIDSSRVFYPLTRISGFGSSGLTISKGSPLNKCGTELRSFPPKSY